MPMRLAGRNSVHLGGCQEIDAIVPSAVEFGRALRENSLVHGGLEGTNTSQSQASWTLKSVKYSGRGCQNVKTCDRMAVIWACKRSPEWPTIDEFEITSSAKEFVLSY